MSQLISGISNVAATAMGFLTGANSNEFALVDSETSLSAFDFDALIQFEVRAEGMVVSAPIEQGSFASYNKVDSPNSLEVVLAKQGTDDVLQAALKTLDSLQTTASKLNFVTPIAEYENYTLESYDFSMTNRDGLGVLYLTLRLVEIREVEPQYTNAGGDGKSKPISTKDAKKPANASTTDRGKTQAKTPTSTQSSKYSSVLSRLF